MSKAKDKVLFGLGVGVAITSVYFFVIQFSNQLVQQQTPITSSIYTRN